MEAECGTVVSVEGRFVIVEAQGGSQCEGCAMGHSCGLGAKDRPRRIRMRNSIGVAEGDRVLFTLQERTVLIASFLLYLFPVAMLIGGAAAGAAAGIPGVDRDLSAAGGGIAALLVSLGIIRLLSRRLERMKSVVPILVGTVPPEGG
ncbi:MAG: SoxR reducing system RseC family protein [Spirochaetes bacterium]|nr:SoxR reducing system RseC family protein [Spirochaetota bacterium]